MMNTQSTITITNVELLRLVLSTWAVEKLSGQLGRYQENQENTEFVLI
jgi:hypothetical protein